MLSFKAQFRTSDTFQSKFSSQKSEAKFSPDSTFNSSFNSSHNFGPDFDGSNSFLTNFNHAQTVTTSIHNELRGRGADEAHPISAISGLVDKFDEVDTEPISTDEIMRMFN